MTITQLELLNLPFHEKELTCPVEPHKFPNVMHPIGEARANCDACGFSGPYDDWVISFSSDPAKWNGLTRWIGRKSTFEPFAEARERITRLFLLREERTVVIEGEIIISYPKGEASE